MVPLNLVEQRQLGLVTELEHKKHIHNAGLSGLSKLTLPPAKQGLEFVFANLLANTMVNVYAAATERIADASAKSIAGGHISSSTGAIAGHLMRLVCLVPGTWNVTEKAGVWTTH